MKRQEVPTMCQVLFKVHRPKMYQAQPLPLKAQSLGGRIDVETRGQSMQLSTLQSMEEWGPH